MINLEFGEIKSDHDKLKLSVVSGTDSFFYGLFNENGKLLLCREGAGNAFGRDLDALLTKFEPVDARFLFSGIPFVQIPEEQYEADRFDLFFRDLYPIEKIKNLVKCTDRMAREDIMTLYPIDPGISAVIDALTLPKEVFHISTAMSNYMAEKKGVFLTVVQNHVLHIAVRKDGRFKFYNQFRCFHREDFLYFISLVLSDHELDSRSTTIHLGGHIARESSLSDLLERYLGHLEFIPEEIFGDPAANLEPHYFLDLQMVNACAL